MILCDFRVHGLPRPKGSPSILRRPNGRPFVLESESERGWEQQIAISATVARRRDAHRDCAWPVRDPVALILDFTFSRPRTSKRERPSVKPDLSKLVRAAEDALNGLIYHDDAQVVTIQASKEYGESPGVRVRVVSLDAIRARRNRAKEARS